MNRSETIEAKLREALAPTHLVVEDESSNHAVPRGSETHFRVLVVSESFEGVGAVDRHRRVNGILKDEFATGLHALSIRSLTPAQWEQDDGHIAPSPPCLGGSK